MLSVSAVTSSGKADYYAKDDYYIGRGSVAGDTKLEWGGEGAARLGLVGVAVAEDFKSVLAGRNPNAEGPAISYMEVLERRAAQKEADALEAREKGEGAPDRTRTGARMTTPSQEPSGAESSPDRAPHRPGTDLTFSAPKSVSVAILVGGDTRLAAAHVEAVKDALTYAETHLAASRVRNGEGKTETHLTGNLVYAQTTHSSSREGDPMVHSHTIVANTTFVEATNDWRALETKHIFKHQKLLGKVYRASLAEAAKSLGYDVRQHKSGTFELDAFKPEELRVFSKATERVERNLAKEVPESGAAKDVVKRIGRPRKLDIEPHQLVERWEREAERAGFNPAEIVAQAREAERGQDATPLQQGVTKPFAGRVAELREAIAARFGSAPRTPYGYTPQEALKGHDPDARAAIAYALQGAEERRAVFSRHEVIERAIDLAPTSSSTKRLERELDALVVDGRVKGIPGGVAAGSVGMITTVRALELEAEIVERMRAGVSTSKAIYSMEAGLQRVTPDAVLAAGHTHAMNGGQTAAAAMILTSRDKVVAVHGAAGVGKTTMFGVVNQAAADKGVEMHGLTPSHSAKGALIESAGMQTNVVAWFTNRFANLAEGGKATAEERQTWGGRVLVVDEASLLSNIDAAKVLRIAEALGVQKTVMVGDQRQHNSPAAGAPLRHLINEKIPVARMEQIMRQKDDSLRFAVTQLSQGRAKDGLRGLEDRIVEVGAGKGDAGLTREAFALWRQGKDEGLSRPIIVQTQLQRSMINSMVTSDLVKRGEITPTPNSASRLVQAQIEGPARWNAGAYQLDQVLVFHAAHQAAGIKKEDHVRVIGIDDGAKRDVLTVQRADGRTATLDLRALGRDGRSKFQAYEEKPGGEIYLGGVHVWERSDVKRGISTGEAFTPLADRGDRYEVRLASGAVAEIAKDDPHLRFIGGGYAMTSHRSQSMTMETAPIGIMASRGANLATLYVQASRGVHDYTLVTDDKTRLLTQISGATGMNLIAHEELGRAAPGAGLGGPAGGAEAPTLGSELRGKSPGLGDREDASQRRGPLEKSIVRDLPMAMPDHSL